MQMNMISEKMKFVLFLAFCLIASSIDAQYDTTSVSLVDKYSLEDLFSLKITTADKYEQKIEDVPANVEIITKNDIEKFGYKSLKELLSHITGFYQIEDHYWLGSSNFGVRGYFKTGPFANVAILVNGVSQMSDKYSDFPDVKITIPIEAIERVEVIKGPMAVIYGNGAFFGAVNVITTTDYSVQEAKNEISVSMGAPSNYKVFFQHGDNSNELKYKLIIGASEKMGLNINYIDLTSNTSYLNYVGLDSNSTTKNHLGYSEVYSGVQLAYKGFRFDFSYNESHKGVYDGSPSYNNGNDLNTEAFNVFVEYNKDINSKTQLISNISFFNHSHMLNYELFRKYYYEIDYQKTRSVLFEANLKWTPTENISILSGISRRTVLDILQISDFGYYGLNYGDGIIGLPEGENYSTNSILSQLTYIPSEKIKIIAGLRIEHLEPYNMYMARGVLSEDSTDNRLPNQGNRYVIEARYRPDNNGLSFMPKLALIVEPADDHFFKLMYSEGVKQASFSENYRQLPGERPQLSSSRIITYELNYYSYGWNNLIINSSLFFNQLNDLIELTNTYDPETGWEIYSSNSGKFNTLGAEIQFIYKPTNALSINARCIYQKTNDMRPDYIYDSTGTLFDYSTLKVAYSPPLLIYANVLYSFKNNLSVAGIFSYVGEMETYWETSSTPENGERLAPKAPAYYILSLNLRKENVFNKNIYINLNINNLLNNKFRYPTTKSNAWIDKGSIDQGFNFLVSCGMKF